MAHPLRADRRRSGRARSGCGAAGGVLLLADPMLEWPSERPLGDPLRPPPMFADTGLLAPLGVAARRARRSAGPRAAKLGGYDDPDRVAGHAVRAGCAISADRLVAHCRIGKGEATIVADADFLDVERARRARRAQSRCDCSPSLPRFERLIRFRFGKVTDLSTGLMTQNRMRTAPRSTARKAAEIRHFP